MLATINRWFEQNRWVGDCVLAAVLLVVLSLAALSNVRSNGAPVVLTVLLVLPLCARRTYPLAVLVATAALCLVQLAVVPAPVPGDFVVPIVVYAAAAHIPDRRWGLAALGAGVLGAGIGALLWTDVTSRYGRDLNAAGSLFLAGVAVVVAGYLLGIRHRERREHNESQLAALAERNQLLTAERDSRAQMGAAAERARIARELHDIVAHSLSVIVIQADGGVAASRAKPEVAPQVLQTIAATSRDALAQMRRMVAVLRSGRYDDSPGYGPAPRIDDLAALVEQVRTAGLPVTLDTVGTARTMTPDAELAAFRVVQEALTNVLKHAGPDASCQVLLHYGAAEVVITVIDDGRGSGAVNDGAVNDGAGHGLTGMRERVGLLGGGVHAGPRDAGGFEVTATVPYRAVGDSGASGDSGNADGSAAGDTAGDTAGAGPQR